VKLLRFEDRTGVIFEVPETDPDFPDAVSRFDGFNNGYSWAYVVEADAA
jgi:hypothetical protein